MRSLRSLRSASRRPVPAERRPHPPAAPRPRAKLEPERRFREAGGPEDLEVHSCACGYVFEARVTTSVRCPHCGDGLAW